jgi:ribosome biogenesis protein Nip4
MNLCAMHLKLLKNKAVKIILRLQSKLGRRWHHFVKLLELNSKDNSISIEVMIKILTGKFGIEMSNYDL